MRRRWSWLIGGVVSAALLWLAFQSVDLEATWRALQTAQYWTLFPALIVYFVGVWLRAVRWHYLLRSVHLLSGRELFPYIVMGYMANNLLPARIGEVVRAYLLARRHRVSAAAILATILVERVLDGLVMLLFIAVTAQSLLRAEWLQRVLTFGVVVFVGALAVLFLVASFQDLARRMLTFMLRRVPPAIAARVDALTETLLQGLGSLRNWRDAGMSFLLTVLSWLAEAAMYLIIALGFNLGLGYDAAVLATGVANLGTIVPSSPGYVGVFEFLVKQTLLLFGKDEATLLSYAIVLHVALYVPVTIWGLIYVWRESLSLGQLATLNTQSSSVDESGVAS